MSDSEFLRSWRDPKTGRTWPDFCSLSTEPLDGDAFELAVDRVMMSHRCGMDALPRYELYSLISRALATIHQLRKESS